MQFDNLYYGKDCDIPHSVWTVAVSTLDICGTMLSRRVVHAFVEGFLPWSRNRSIIIV